jgi:hypothetical protein
VQNGDSVNKIYFFIIISLVQSCSFSNEKYNKLIDPIKKIKIAEKKAGKPNPTFDGFIEPDFPDEDENNKTLEGVDLNKDGVRDDVEIWINRTANDQYVRAAMKDYYITLSAAYFVFENNSAPKDLINSLDFKNRNALLCLDLTLAPYKGKYLESKIEIDKFYSDAIFELTFNFYNRSTLVSRANQFQYKVHTFNTRAKVDFCTKDIPISYINEIMNKYFKGWEIKNEK